MGTIDYAANSHASKEPPIEKVEAEKVITGSVVKKKKSLGGKFREVFIGADAKSIAMYIITDVLIPGARDIFFDTVTKGAGRMAYGERGGRSGVGISGMKTPYNTPVNRAFSSGMNAIQTVPFGNRMFQQPNTPKATTEDFVLSNREDAEVIIDKMNDRIQQYGAMSLYDLKKMLGSPTAHTDNKWGWESLRGAQMKQVREGWLMELPNPIQI